MSEHRPELEEAQKLIKHARRWLHDAEKRVATILREDADSTDSTYGLVTATDGPRRHLKTALKLIRRDHRRWKKAHR